MGFQQIAQWMESNWDRQAYLVVMRRIEILLMNNLQEKAVSVLRQFIAWSRPEPVSLSSPVGDVLPARIANSLEESGYDTLAAAAGATDSELLRLRIIGSTTVRLIRAAADAARKGQRLPEYIQDRASELRPEFEIDWDYFQQFEPQWNDLLLEYIDQSLPKESPMEKTTAVSAETNSLNLLLKSIESPEQTIAQLDVEIIKRQADLDNLRRLRRVLAVQSKPKWEGTPKNSEESEQKILAAVAAEPKTCKQIQAATGLDYAYVGRIAARSDKLTRLPDGKIAAA